MSMCVLKPYVDEIAALLKDECDRFGGALPELPLIAWHAYLMTDVMDHVDYEKVRQYLPNLEEDSNAENPVHAMAIGKHNKRNPNISPGGFIHQTKLEELVNDIEDELAHFSGQLPAGYVVALSGRFLGLRDCREITEEEYKQLKAMLPVLENDPVKEVEAATRTYVGV